MNKGTVYSLKLERLSVERQQCVIRILLAITSSLLLIKSYLDQNIPEYGQTLSVLVLLNAYSLAVWAIVKWLPERLRVTLVASTIFEILLITYIVRSTAGTDIPFYLWYIFYVVSVATRYGRQYSILAMSACIVSFTGVVFFAPGAYAVNVPAVIGFTGFLLVLAFMFGQISERQLTYQASLAVVNEFRAELAALATPRDILDHLLARTRELINVEHAFFLPARRGADASEAPGLRSSGADPVLLSTFREGGGIWNVEEVLKEQEPMLTNDPVKDTSLPESTIARLGLRNLVVAPMMVRSVPVGVIYAANRRDKPLANSDMQMLELVATQAAPVVENAVLWERLRESAASEERLRIARDLHDNVLQTLAGIKLHLERSKILVRKDTARALESIDRIHEIATRGLGEVRVYLSELRLMGPEPSRFRQAIERCAADAAARGGFQTHIEIESPDEAMPPNVALSAFQILRELLNNVVSHAKAKHVEIRVDAKDGKLSIEVEDDGQGFEVSRIRAEKASAGHLGLVGVEERARQSNGVFTLVSEPNKGTRATAVLTI